MNIRSRHPEWKSLFSPFQRSNQRLQNGHRREFYFLTHFFQLHDQLEVWSLLKYVYIHQFLPCRESGPNAGTTGQQLLTIIRVRFIFIFLHIYSILNEDNLQNDAVKINVIGNITVTIKHLCPSYRWIICPSYRWTIYSIFSSNLLSRRHISLKQRFSSNIIKSLSQNNKRVGRLHRN